MIDAQYFTRKDIGILHENEVTVYTYLNIGSIENFREYYADYEKLALGDYEHWEEEKWMDVSSPDWQKFIGCLARELYEKGVDGFFIDNCDVYYYASAASIFDGLTVILQDVMSLGKEVIINGGDVYVTEYRERYGTAKDIMTGVNQESVWSGIDFDKGTFYEQNKEDRDYFCNYVESCKADGAEVYLLEYTTDSKLIQKIEEYCKKHDFRFYISDSLELEVIRDDRKRKMISGELYDSSDKELEQLRLNARKLARKYNLTDEDCAEEQTRILRELLSETEELPYLQAPVYFDYGCNTFFGKSCFANFNFTCLDVGEIHIGDNVLIGPNVTLATPMHPLLPEERNIRKREDGSFYNLEYAKPITIKDNCWLASNVVVCGGVTIGEGCVIGAGSVVTRDIPPYSLAAGNPCRVIRKITEEDHMYGLSGE